MPTIDRAAIIGKGFCADVYAWGDGRVLKLFHGPNAIERARREFAVTSAVHSTGLPVPATHDLIEIEGRPGIVMERIEGLSLLKVTEARPWTIFNAVRLAARLHADIHRCVAPASLGSLHERIAARIDESDAPELDKQAAKDQLANLPDGNTLCHGDFHPGNVLITARGPVVVDWSSACRGHAMGDVACTSHLMRKASLPPWSPWYAHLLLRCLRSAMHRSYLRSYFRCHAGSRQQIEGWQMPLAVAAKSWQDRRND